MNERITKQMVEDGLWQNVIKIRFEDMNEFIVTIGDNWFYSGGQDSDWRNASSIFDLVAHITRKTELLCMLLRVKPAIEGPILEFQS